MEMVRKKTMATFTIAPEVIARLEKWLADTFEFSPGKSAIVEKALVDYLDRKEEEERAAAKKGSRK